jgi:hypothetical protein
MQVYLQIPRWWYEISQHHYDPIRSSALLMALSLILRPPLLALIGCEGIKSTTWAHVGRRSESGVTSRRLVSCTWQSSHTGNCFAALVRIKRQDKPV